MDSWVVLKFGGTSVTTLTQWQTIANIVRQCQACGERPFVVFSALGHVSRRLEALIRAVTGGDGSSENDWIREQHLDLAKCLDLNGRDLLSPYFQELERLSLGISLTAESSPATQARVLAIGELMLTTLGAAYLQKQGIEVIWLDARTLLRAVEEPRMIPHRRYLAATCSFEPDSELQRTLAGSGVAVTQGFIAGNDQGQTVLMGWGGSDTSAACFAAKLQALRLEIWTDVPGMFTADPRLIPSARMLRYLDYDEAQELASTGAEVLHPHCLRPLRDQHIPLYLRCTDAPGIEGTEIAAHVHGHGAQIKAISMRAGLTLIALETPQMWHQVGFLSRAFAVFERYGLSIGLVATSETNVTVSIDPIHGAEPESNTLNAVLSALGSFCRARLIGPCAAVSLVGRQLRSVLHELGPALEVLDEQQVLLVTQAASDFNFTFVVEEPRALRLVTKLHAQVFAAIGAQDPFGATYRELFEADTPAASLPWWHARRDDLLALETPRYVYDAATLYESASRLQKVDTVDRSFYAMKACTHADVLRVFHSVGLAQVYHCAS